MVYEMRDIEFKCPTDELDRGRKVKVKQKICCSGRYSYWVQEMCSKNSMGTVSRFI